MRNDGQEIAAASLVNDYIKHITTLSTGSLLLTVAFLDKVFPSPESKWLIGFSMASFLVAIIGGAIFATINSMQIYEKIPDEELKDWMGTLAKIGIVFLWFGFLLGVGSIVVFGFKNFF